MEGLVEDGNGEQDMMMDDCHARQICLKCFESALILSLSTGDLSSTANCDDRDNPTLALCNKKAAQMRPDVLLRHRPTGFDTATASATNQTAICAGSKILILVPPRTLSRISILNRQTPRSRAAAAKSDFEIVDFDIESLTSRFGDVRAAADER